MATRASALLLFTAIFAIPSAALAEQHFGSGTDGERIEIGLRELVNSCMGGNQYSTKFLPKSITTSAKFASALGRNREGARLIEGVRFDRLARTVFDGNRELPTQLKNAPATKLPLDISLPESTAISDASNLTFGMTCGTSLKLALDQGFDFSWFGAAASVKQALNVQSDASAKNSLLLSYGVFWSPLYLALNSKEPEIRGRAHAAVLGYYLEKESKGVAKPVFIKSIVGWLMTEGSSRDVSNMLKASAGASASMWGLNADISSEAQLGYNTKLSSSAFTIILDRALDPSSDTAPLPEVSEISKAISGAARFPDGEILYTVGVKFPLTANLYGVPAWLCGKQWKPETNLTATLDNVREVYNANDGVCSISFDAKVFSAARSMDVAFKNTRSTGAKEDMPQVEIRHSYLLGVQSSPKIVQLDRPTVMGDKNSSFPSYTIDVPFNVYPAGQSKDVAAKSNEKVVLECPGYVGDYTDYASNVRVGSASRPFIYSVPITFSKSPPTEPCILKGKVDFVYSVDGKTSIFTEQLNAAQVFFPPLQ